MKYFAVCALTLVAFASAVPVKRSAGFGGLFSSGGGNRGCVVTGNKLYINGIFEKDLNSGEQEEFAGYQQRLNLYKTEIRQVLNQRRKELLEKEGKTNGNSSMMINVIESSEVSSTSSSNGSLPKTPEKPSFCQGGATTQYVFDGCKVQVSSFTLLYLT